MTRERWFGATGRRVPEIAVEGELELRIDVALAGEDVSDEELRDGARGRAAGRRPRMRTRRRQCKAALAHPEVACVLVPPERRELLDLDLTALTYG